MIKCGQALRKKALRTKPDCSRLSPLKSALPQPVAKKDNTFKMIMACLREDSYTR